MKLDQQWVRAQLEDRLGEMVHAGVLTEVLRAVDDEDGDFADIAASVHHDPYLTSRVLAMANLVPNAGEEVASLDRAVQMLGVRQVHALTIAAMMMAMARTAVPPGDRSDLWRWVFGCAVASGWLESRLAEADGTRQPHEAQGIVGAMGLLMGVLIMRAGLGSDYAGVLGRPPEPSELAEREQKRFGVTHYGVAAAAMEVLQCPRFMLRYPLALDAREDDLSVVTGRSVELFGALLAGFDAEACEAWLIDGLPRLGIDGFDAIEAAPVLRDQAAALTRRLKVDAGQWPMGDAALMVAGSAVIQEMLADQLTVGQSLRLSAAEIAESFEARQEAATDPLTGLLNRRGMAVELDETVGDRQGSVGLVMIDVDRFKRVNDALGHGVGDAVLIAVADALRATVPQALLLGRVGGDEFLAVAPTGGDEFTLWEWTEELRFNFRDRVASLAPEATLSIGALATPAATLRIAWSLACDRADELMYEAKRSGGNRAAVSAVFEDGELGG